MSDDEKIKMIEKTIQDIKDKLEYIQVLISSLNL